MYGSRTGTRSKAEGKTKLGYRSFEFLCLSNVTVGSYWNSQEFSRERDFR